MNIADLITEARTMLDEPSEKFYLNTELTKWANQGQKDIAVRAKCYEKASTITLSVGVYFYEVPTDCLVVAEVLNYLGINLNKITPSEANAVFTSSGKPTFWYEFGRKIYVRDTPSATYVTDLIKTYPVLYFALPPDTALLLSIPEQYHHIIPLFMHYRGLQKAEQYQEAMGVLQLYEKKVEEVRTLYSNKPESKNETEIPKVK